MKNFLETIPSTYVSAFGWTLLHSVWQAALICTLAALGFYLLRRYSAQARYTLGVTMLGMQILASLATYLYYLPSAIEKASSSVLISYPSIAQQVGFSGPAAPLPTLMKIQLWLITHLNELVICWCIGVGILLLRFAGGWFYLERLRFASRPIKDQVWHTRFGVLVAKLNIGRSVELRETARIITPMVVGVLWPIVLVPIGLIAGLSVKEVEAVLAHELAHIRRHDYFANLVQSFVEVVYFFHPALWWLSARIRTEREHCCDDLAMDVCHDRLSLAHALVRVAEFRHESQLVIAFAANKPLLLRRIRRVLGVAEPAGRSVARWQFLGYLPMAVVLLSFLVGASVYAFQREETKQEKLSLVKFQDKGDEVPILPATLHKSIADATIERELSVSVAKSAEVPFEVTLDNFALSYEFSDTTQKKMAEFHAKMQEYQQQMQPYHKEIQALQQQMQPLHQQIAELQLRMEKEQFEVERFQREQEKVEWKKQNAQQARQQLMEKRSAILHPKNSQAKANTSDLEKQLAEFEAQIKSKEQEITALNDQIKQNHEQAKEAEKPLDNLNAEIEKINQEAEVFERKMEEVEKKAEVIGRKMEAVSKEMGLETMNYIDYQSFQSKAPMPPSAPRAPKAPGAVEGKIAPVPAAPPVPPVPPKKK